MTSYHYFWGQPRPSQVDPDYGRSASRMYLVGNTVFIEGEMHDREDDRRYEYSGSFRVDDYRRALQKLQEEREAQIVSPINGRTLSLKKRGNRAEITLSSTTFPSSTPGGATLASTVVFTVPLEQLQLP